MSMERMAGQGYAPIPQNISNTDTEDEDEHLTIPTDNCHEDSGKIRNTIGDQENGWCHATKDPRNFAKDSVHSQAGYRYCGDDIPIMITESEAQNDFWKRREMSKLRRFCLVLSILVCFATLLIFLYALPCDDASICPPIVENRTVIAWDKTLKGVEIHSPISIVHETPYSLIFLLRGQRFGVDTSKSLPSHEIPSDGGVVLSMQGNTGTLLWWVPLPKKVPINIDCTSFDTDGSGKPDCIVTGNDLLVSIDPVAGTIHWTSSHWTNSELPLLIPDVDGDAIDDLLCVTRHGFPEGGMIILSGKTGKFLSEYLNPDCESYASNSIRLNRLESSNDISYTCEGKESPKQTLNLTVSLNEFLHGNNSNFPDITSNYVSNETAVLQSLPMANENTDNYVLNLTPYYQLNVRNFGPCPGEDCHVIVNVTLRNIGSTNRAIWNHSSENSYAMKPAVYSIDDKPYVTGFAIKFWQWNDDKKYPEATDKYFKRRLSEKVVMVFLNYTDVHEINASQSDIVQLCNNEDCQPSLKLQTRSIAIADLGGDGTWELINYQSSYNNEIPVILTSRVQIVKLDTDLFRLTQTTLN